MIKRIKILATGALLLAGLGACSPSGKKTGADSTVDTLRTAETVNLLNNLLKVPTQGIMFGHHDDPLYGVGWEGDEDRSDVKSVCGDYPAVMSFDLGHIELEREKSLDNVPFRKIRQETINQYKRGGVVSFSWHLDNPLTGKDAWDVSDTTVVASILPGGVHHAKFISWLDAVAAFMNTLETEEGTKIPVIFRPWHEHTGSWFWWGQNLCTADQYKALWRMTHDRMHARGVKNLLYAYSPGSEPQDSTAYLERYPGDDIIDLVGFDTYQFDRTQYMEQLDKSLAILTEVGKAHDKPIAITETGFEAIPDSVWWTQTLYPVISKYPISYVLVWRNARERVNHYYAPYPGQVSADDFVKFYREPKTLFVSDVNNLYK